MLMDWGHLAIVIGTLALQLIVYIAVGIGIGIVMLKYMFWRIDRERRKLAGVQLADIDRMSGEQFESYLEVLFERLGYDTNTTERYDKGADLLLYKEGVRTAVQAKCRANDRVGVEAVRAVVASLRPYRCTRGIVVTNGYFTRPAAQVAKDNHIELWDRDDLANLILALNNPGQPLPIPPAIAWILHAPRTAPVASLAAPLPAANYTCATCARQVTKGIRQYCLDQPDRFGGKVYCMDHQRQAANAPVLRHAEPSDHAAPAAD
jgi:restriction system protein